MDIDEYLANIQNYKMLAGTIVQRAAEDYVAALKSENKLLIMSLERFFRSQEFLLYTGGNIDPEYIIENLQKKARKGKRWETDTGNTD